MPDDIVHMVCLDAPAPPDYGGAIDMYYKIKALHEVGKKIILHYFNYRPDRSVAALEPYCVAIHAYSRNMDMAGLNKTLPFIVSSRINKQLINRLQQDEHPVLLEGIHCTGLLPYLNGNLRKIVVRVHNDEAAYYRQLAIAETNILKKLYFFWESRQLKKYQAALSPRVVYAPLSQTDASIFEKTYQLKTAFIPAFTPWGFQKVSVTGNGSYCLYQGNLSIAENRKAVAWLVKQVFSKMDVPLIVAGKNVPAAWYKWAVAYPHIQFINSPDDEQLEGLIANAHIHVLPSFNKTGVKLKLLHALLQGRFCLTNTAGAAGTGIHKGLLVADTPQQWRHLIQETMSLTFSDAHTAERQEVAQLYDNHKNAQQLSALLC